MIDPHVDFQEDIHDTVAQSVENIAKDDMLPPPSVFPICRFMAQYA